MRHDYTIRNAGAAPLTELSLWIVDGQGEIVSTRAGGGVVLAPGEAAHASVEVSQPLPDNQTLLVSWRDVDGEHTEPSGISPPRHM